MGVNEQKMGERAPWPHQGVCLTQGAFIQHNTALLEYETVAYICPGSWVVGVVHIP